MATPELDRMAAGGMILRQHYTAAPVCAPARASLLLGQHQGDCPIRDNQFDKALPRNHTLGTVLQAAGYFTGMIGKFGLPGPSPDIPDIRCDTDSTSFTACCAMTPPIIITLETAARSWTCSLP